MKEEKIEKSEDEKEHAEKRTKEEAMQKVIVQQSIWLSAAVIGLICLATFTFAQAQSQNLVQPQQSLQDQTQIRGRTQGYTQIQSQE